MKMSRQSKKTFDINNGAEKKSPLENATFQPCIELWRFCLPFLCFPIVWFISPFLTFRISHTNCNDKKFDSENQKNKTFKIPIQNPKTTLCGVNNNDLTKPVVISKHSGSQNYIIFWLAPKNNDRKKNAYSSFEWNSIPFEMHSALEIGTELPNRKSYDNVIPDSVFLARFSFTSKIILFFSPT